MPSVCMCCSVRPDRGCAGSRAQMKLCHMPWLWCDLGRSAHACSIDPGPGTVDLATCGQEVSGSHFGAWGQLQRVTQDFKQLARETTSSLFAVAPDTGSAPVRCFEICTRVPGLRFTTPGADRTATKDLLQCAGSAPMQRADAVALAGPSPLSAAMRYLGNRQAGGPAFLSTCLCAHGAHLRLHVHEHCLLGFRRRSGGGTAVQPGGGSHRGRHLRGAGPGGGGGRPLAPPRRALPAPLPGCLGRPAGA